MTNYFECKVSFEQTQEDGKVKRVTEPYLVDALSFTDAEARIIEELKPYISGEYKVEDIKRANLSEIFFTDGGELYFKSKVQFITLNEKTKKEKKTSVNILIQADNLTHALKVLEKGMEGTMSDYNKFSITETAIKDVFTKFEPKPIIL